MTGSKSKTSSACVGSAISLSRSRGAQSAGSDGRNPSANASRANSGLAARNCSKRRRLTAWIGCSDIIAPQKEVIVAQFVRLSECNPGALHYDIVVKASQRRLGFNNLGGKT